MWLGIDWKTEYSIFLLSCSVETTVWFFCQEGEKTRFFRKLGPICHIPLIASNITFGCSVVCLKFIWVIWFRFAFVRTNVMFLFKRRLYLWFCDVINCLNQIFNDTSLLNCNCQCALTLPHWTKITLFVICWRRKVMFPPEIRRDLLTHCTSIRHVILSVRSSVSFFPPLMLIELSKTEHASSPPPPLPRHLIIMPGCSAGETSCTAPLRQAAGSVSQQHSTFADKHYRYMQLRSPVGWIHPLWSIERGNERDLRSSLRKLWILQGSGMRRRGVRTNLPKFRKK
jgi:hypothetical protein